MCLCCASGAQKMRATLAAKWLAEVWGHPISHSLSPALHNAAYRALGENGHYEARDVSSAGLEGALTGLSSQYRGISLTMPLKEEILGLVADHRGLVDELGAANTIVIDAGGQYLWNTDPAGVAGALEEAGIEGIADAVILGAGATARSVVAALADRGLTSLRVFSRDEERSETTLSYARSKCASVVWEPLEEVSAARASDLVVSCLPHGVDVSAQLPEALVEDTALFDVSYAPWPSTLATRFEGRGGPVVSGKSMLLHQALAQIRLFVHGDVDRALTNEPAVLGAMRDAIS